MTIVRVRSQQAIVNANANAKAREISKTTDFQIGNRTLFPTSQTTTLTANIKEKFRFAYAIRSMWTHPKGLFTSSESERESEKKVKEQPEENKEKISNIKENFRFRVRFRSVWTEP